MLALFSPVVFGQLLRQVQCSCMMASVNPCSTDRVSVFQLLVYLKRWNITDFGEHISHLSKEGNATNSPSITVYIYIKHSKNILCY